MRKIALLGISAFVFSFNAYAVNGTTIKIAEVNAPVSIGVFRGACNTLNFTTLQTTNDFASIATRTCQFVTDKTMNPKKPKDSLKVWHGGPALTLVAFQKGEAPIQCPIEYAYKTMFVLGGGNGLKCTSPQAAGDTAEEDDNEPQDPNLESDLGE